MEEYPPLFAKWTGSGQHFGFMNQPSAGFANYQVLVESVVPVICAARGPDTDPEPVVKEFLEEAVQKFQSSVDGVFRVKLGFEDDADGADDLWESLEPLMRTSRVDWTVFFRQLTYVARDFNNSEESADYEAMLAQLVGDDKARPGSSPFYEPLDANSRAKWLEWIERWHKLHADGGSLSSAYDRMRNANPKYVLREWMLKDAYDNAADGQEAELTYLYSLVQRPYDEGTEHEERRYYRRAPDDALTTGGTAFMS